MEAILPTLVSIKSTTFSLQSFIIFIFVIQCNFEMKIWCSYFYFFAQTFSEVTFFCEILNLIDQIIESVNEMFFSFIHCFQLQLLSRDSFVMLDELSNGI